MSRDDRIFVSVKEACHRLGVGKTRLYALLGAGCLAARKSGRLTLVEVASLDRWAASLPAAKFAAPSRVAAQSMKRGPC